MKKLILILLTFCPLLTLAQRDDKLTVKDLGIADPKAPLYIINEVLLDKQARLDTINPKDILEVTILKDASAITKYGARGANGVVIVVLKKFAITTYQENIGLHSDDYESYLTSHGTDDSQFIYVLNGEALTKDKETSALYHLNKDSIDTVVFTQKEPEGSKVLARVLITTKK